MSVLSYKGYLGRYEFHEEDDLFRGRLRAADWELAFEGRTIGDLKDSFASVVEDFLESCAKEGRTPEQPLKEAALAADGEAPDSAEPPPAGPISPPDEAPGKPPLKRPNPETGCSGCWRGLLKAYLWGALALAILQLLFRSTRLCGPFLFGACDLSHYWGSNPVTSAIWPLYWLIIIAASLA